MQKIRTALGIASSSSAGEINAQAWLMVWKSMLATACCSTAALLVNLGIFIKPLADAHGWSRGDISLALSIAAIAMAAANPFVGRFIDKFGVRPVILSSLFSYGIATAAFPTLVDIGGLTGLYFGYALIAVLGAGSNVIAYTRVLSGWFSGSLNKHRGLALGISSAGLPLGAAIAAPLGVIFIEKFGWQGGYWGLSLMPLLIGLPLAALGIRMNPNEGSTKVDTGSRQLDGMSLSDAMTTRAFWLLIVIVFLMSTTLQGLGIHTPPLLSDYDLAPLWLGLVLSLNQLMGVAGRVGAGYLFDRYFAPYVSVFVFGLAGIAAFALAGFPGLTVAIAATLLITIGSGAESDFIGYTVGRYFGLKCFGQIFGTIYAVFMIGIAVGPYFFGVAFDAWASYTIPFALSGVGLVLICVLLMLLPRFPNHVENSK